MPGLFVKHHAESVLPFAKVSVLYIHSEDRRDGELLTYDFQEEDGLATMRVYLRKSPGLIGKLFNLYLYFYASLKGYSRLIAQEGKADMHHVHILTRAGVLPWILRISGGVPYLITEHWSRYHKANRHQMKGKFHRWLTKQVIKKAYAVCPVNKELGASMQDMGFNHPRYRYINNVVNMDRFSIAKETASFKRFLHVSCFDEKPKNTKGLLRAFKAAVQSDPSLFLTLVGNGPDWQESKDYAAELGILAYIDFTGLLEGNALVEQFHQNAHLLMFSRYENQPVVIIEAMACGLHVISTEVGGIGDLLADGRGRLIPSEDENAMTSEMLSASKGENRKAPEELRQYVLENFSFESVGKAYSELYLEALAE